MFPKEGTVLGPLLLLIYINNLPRCITNKIRLFADDCVIYATITNHADQVTLQSDLTAIQNWCHKWQMSLNISKCKSISFQRRTNPFSYNYSLGGCFLQSTNSYKYLGVHITSDLSWSLHINHVVSAASRSLGYLQRTLKFAPSPLKILAFTTIIRPKLEYAAAIWDPHQKYLIQNIEAIQNRAARFAFSDYSSFTSVTELKKRAALPPLFQRRKIARLALFYKFYHATPSSIYITPRPHFSDRRSNSKQVQYPRPKTNTFAESFFIRTAKDWNALPDNIVSIRDTEAFKRSLMTLTEP